jgi:hypothetical protein
MNNLRKPQGKRQYGRCTSRWKENVKTDTEETGCGGVDWIHLTQD